MVSSGQQHLPEPEEISAEREILLQRRGRHYAFPALGELPGGRRALLFHDAPSREPETLFDPESRLAIVTATPQGHFSPSHTLPVPRFSFSGYAPSIVPLHENHLLVSDNSWHVYHWMGEPNVRIIEKHEWVVLLRGAHTIEIDASGDALRFGKPRRVASLNYPVATCYGPPILENANSILLAVDYNIEAHQLHDRPWETVLMKSPDLGETWSMAGRIYFEPDMKDLPKLHSPCAVKSPAGDLICSLESFTSAPKIFISRSADGGASWSPPAPAGLTGYYHFLLQLADGRFLLSLTPAAPNPASAADAFPHHDDLDLFFSEDGGSSWNNHKRILVERKKKSPAGCIAPRPSQLPGGDLYFTFHSFTVKDTRALCGVRVPL